MDLTRPFTRRSALAAGVDPAELRQARRLFRGVYVDRLTSITPRLRAEAALLPFPPGSFLSHASAGRLWDVPMPVIADEHVTVVAAAHRRTRAGIRCHLGAATDVVQVCGVRASSPQRMFVELAEQLTLVDLVVVGDALVRDRRTTTAELAAFVAASRLPGAGAAREAVAFVRDRVDSPMETRTRMLLVLAGLPEPEINPEVTIAGRRRRYDLRYRRSGTIVEYDGRQHAESDQQWKSDVARREDIDDSGERIVVLLSKDIYRTPEATLRRLQRILRERGEPGVPSVLSDAWRPHFPGQP